jgi:ribosome-associated protein
MGAKETQGIRLDQFLKRRGVTGTGGQAKWLIQDGQVLVNGQIETRRRRNLHAGDTVDVGDLRLTVESEEADE